MISSDTAAKASSLSDTQRSYLLLVAEGKTSKQIAQLVSGSYHTVNVEISIAMRVLGARSRHEAAKILSDLNEQRLYEHSYEPATIAEPTTDREGLNRNGGNERTSEAPGWALPIPAGGRRTNRLTGWQRVGWILVIASLTALLLAGLVSGITSLLTNLRDVF